MEKNIAVIWGDCSSPEIVKQTIRVLDKVVPDCRMSYQPQNSVCGSARCRRN